MSNRPSEPGQRERSEATTTAHRGESVRRLQARVDQQQLMIEALMRLLLDKGVIEEMEFRARLEELDVLDGHRDGKLRADESPKTCHACNRKSPPDIVRCQYCGAEFPHEFLDLRE